MTFSLEYALYAKALIGVLAIVNPLGAIPIFLSLRGNEHPQNVARSPGGARFQSL